MIDYYPPWGFYYAVKFDFSSVTNDTRFQSVSGLVVEYDMEEYKEGGENRFTHKLPFRTKYSDLVLKRGMLVGSAVVSWCLAAFRDRDFQPADIIITLMNEKSEPLRVWNVTHAIPKKWSVSDLNANENSIVIETLELTYQYFTVLAI
jgi:phage tail-like protein